MESKAFEIMVGNKEESWLPLLTTQSTESSGATKRGSEALLLNALRGRRRERERQLERLEINLKELEWQRKDAVGGKTVGVADLESLEQGL